MSRSLADSHKPVTLTNIIGKWIKDDHILNRHFRVGSPGSCGVICHDCRWPKSPYANLSDLGEEYYAAKIFDNEVWVVFVRFTLYKFKAIHPMFFQKLRGHLYDQHNRHQTTCKEYLR